MNELFVDQHGEVRLGSDVVGTIQWAGPCAFYGVTGEWGRDAGDCCYDCGGGLASAEAFEEVEEERDRLEVKIKHLRQALEGMMVVYDRAGCNPSMPEYKAAREVLSALEANADA